MCSLPGQVGMAICSSRLGLEWGESHTLLRYLPKPAFRHLISLISASPLGLHNHHCQCACRQATSQVDDRDWFQVGRHLCTETQHLETQRSLRRTARVQSHQKAQAG